jgi:RNA-directed DNA polymerase
MMNFELYSKRFTQKAIEAGYSHDIITRCLSYVKPIIDHGLPVIYNLSHFAGLVGYKTNYLTRAVFFTEFFYRHFKIEKHNGSLREISEPLPSLKEIQQWILKEILYKAPVSKFAKAYIEGSNLKQNVHFHKGQKVVVKFDIENFFDSINRAKVEDTFKKFGYSPILSNLFGKLCCLKNRLPQGAPTSPYLSNLILRDFDDEIGKYCVQKKIRYTRYADDLTFSGIEINIAEIEQIISSLLKQLDLRLNNDKTKVMKQGQRQVVTGIVVNDKLQVERKKRKYIRQQIYYIKKHGLENHLDKIQNNKSNYIDHLLGQVNFVLSINNSDIQFKEYNKFLRHLKKNYNIKGH